MKKVTYILVALSLSIFGTVGIFSAPKASAAGYFSVNVQNPGITTTSSDQISYSVTVTANSLPSYLLNTTYNVYPVIMSDANFAGDYYSDDYQFSTFTPTANGNSYTMTITSKFAFIGANYLGCFVFHPSGLYSDTSTLCDNSGGYVVNYTGKTTPIYRFWSNTYKHHFYTNSAAEMTNVSVNMQNVWYYEGTLFSAVPLNNGSCTTGSQVYRFWSDTYKGHFYTISAVERDSIIATNPNWRYEGAVYCAGTGSGNADVPTPLFRFWSNTYKGHFYTTSVAERDSVIATNPNWKYEGVAFYVK